MMDFTSINELKNYLIYDQKRATLNPVRFINVETMAIWIEVKKIVLSLSDRTLFLSEFCESDDTTPNIRRVTSALKTYDKTTCVAPLSEYLRINPELAQSTILKILSADYKNNENGGMRIYFLMYRMKDILRNIPNDDPRRQDTLLYLNTSDEVDYSLTIVQDDLKVSLHGNEIFGFKKYLQYWEQNPNKPLILHTKNAIYFEGNNFFDNVLVIASSYDLLRYKYNFPSKILASFGEKDQWKKFAQLVSDEGSVDAAFKSAFRTNKFAIDIFEKWGKFSSFERWLLWIWIKMQNADSYIFDCANSSNSSEEFQGEIFTGITKYLPTSKFDKAYNERKKILRLIGESAIPPIFWSTLDSLYEIDALRCLTDLNVAERTAIFDLTKRIGYDYRKECYKVLRTVYPDLASYLECDTQNPAKLSKEHAEYFSEYKWLKVTNSLTDGFIAKVKKYAEAKGESVYQLKPRNYIINELYDDETAILFVDGMGVEYIDYLSAMFADLPQSEYNTVFLSGYCNLPSVTDANKDFLTNRNALQPICSLDELKHSNANYPISITKEFDELKKVREIVLNSFNNSIKKIIITSDHGTSRLAVLVRNSQYDEKYKAGDIPIYRYGRYCVGTDMEEQLPTAINYDGKLIFADYSRFEQKGAPSNEIHGGASLEEWLVPIISIEKYNKIQTKSKITIETNTPIVQPELGTGKITIIFNIIGKNCNRVYATINGQKLLCESSDCGYKFDYVPSRGATEINVKISDTEPLGMFTVTIKQKIMRNKNFDI